MGATWISLSGKLHGCIIEGNNACRQVIFTGTMEVAIGPLLWNASIKLWHTQLKQIRALRFYNVGDSY